MFQEVVPPGFNSTLVQLKASELLYRSHQRRSFNSTLVQLKVF